MFKRYFLPAIAVFLLVLIVVFLIRKPGEKPDRWAKMYVGAGSSGSPRAADLNGDGVLDIIMGAGDEEFKPTDFAVFAIDGNNGEILWKVDGINQIFGTPVLRDITGDSIVDVFIAGRSAQLFAVDGSNGELLWQFIDPDDTYDLRQDTTLLNFYNPVFIPDQNNDGADDLIVTFGGYVSALPEDRDRPAGWLMVIDGITGLTIQHMPMPDGKECYMSPVVFESEGRIWVLFGSGGETIGGHFYRIALEDLMADRWNAAIVLDSGRGKGFIAPPVLADVTKDDYPDFIINAMDGRIIAFNGITNQKIWELDFGKHAETQSTVVPGMFNGDAIPDFFATIGHGTWPAIDTVSHFFINGSDGTVMMGDTLGIMQLSTGVTFDMDQDGIEDVIHVVNSFANDDYYDRHFINQVYVYNYGKGKIYSMSEVRTGMNVGSSPLITDLDQDGNVDFIFTYNSNDYSLSKFEHLVIERVEFIIPFEASNWPGYMGDGSSFYRPE